MKAPWSMVPLLPLTGAFVCGVLLSLAGLSLWWALIPLLFAVIAAIGRQAFVAVMFAMTALGFADGVIHRPSAPRLADSETQYEFSGVIQDVADGESSRRLDVIVDSVSGQPCHKFTMAIYVPSFATDYPLTARVRFIAAAEPPVVEMDLPDELDYNATLLRRGVSLKAFVPEEQIELRGLEPGLMNTIRRQRDVVCSAIYGSGLNDATSTFLVTMLTGDASTLTDSDREQFSRSGLAHILALSGLHVAIIVWVVSLMLWPLYLTGLRRTRFAVTILILWAFAVMTGLTPSVTRAVVMATVFFAAMMFGLRRSPLNALCLAALLILLFSPRDVLTPGFQLSFLSSASILIFAPRLNPVSRRRPRLRSAVDLLCVSLAAMLGTCLLAAFYFHIFPVYFLLSNVFAGLFVPVLIAGGVLMLLFMAVGIPHEALCRLLEAVCSAIGGVSDFVASLPGASVDRVEVSPWIVVTYFVALLCLLAYARTRRPLSLMMLASALVCGVVLSLALSPHYARSAVYLTTNNGSTDVVVKEDHWLQLMSVALSESARRDALSRARHRYDLYMLKRQIDSITPAPKSFSTSLVWRNNDTLIIRDHHFVFVNSDSSLRRPLHATDLVVCRGFRGDVVALARHAGASRVVLSADLSKKRHDKYADSLSAHAIEFHSLRSDGALSWLSD